MKKVPSQDENDLDKSILLIRSLLETGTTTYVDSLGHGDGSIDNAKISADLDSSTALSVRTTSNTIVIMGAYGGRFDQEMATVSSLFRWLHIFDRVVMLGDRATSFLLQPGYLHRIRCVNLANPCEQTNTGVAREGPTCGLIPIGGRVNSITTTGLQWDLREGSLQMGVCVSSSNSVRPGASEVTVETSDTVLWTVELVDL